MNSDFEMALEAGDLAAIRRCPKSDLHVHAVLGGNREWLRERTGRDVAPLDGVLGSMDEMHAWTKAQVGDLFVGAGRALAYEATFAQARLDGVTKIEVGADVWEVTHYENSGQAVWDMLRAAHDRGGPVMEWIPQMAFSRHCPTWALERWMAPMLELGVFQTLDLSGDEFAQPIEVFAPLYRRAKAGGLRLKAHVGEWGSADDVWRAVELLELEEVQHGIAAADSPQVMRALAEAGVRLNICPTSNLKLGRVARMEDHPIRRLFDAGVRVTVNSDDPLMFGNGVSEEYLALFRAGVMTAAELDAVRLEGLRPPAAAA
jgi:adenosine deaminase